MFRRSTVLDIRWNLLLYFYTHIGHFPFFIFAVLCKSNRQFSEQLTYEYYPWANFLTPNFKSGLHTQTCLCDIHPKQDLDINGTLQAGITNLKFLECQIGWSDWICIKVTHIWNKKNHFGTQKVTVLCIYSLPPVHHSKHKGRFIMFSVISNIYKKKTKGPTLMELFTATGKLKRVFLKTRDVWCVHHGWHGTHRYDIQVLATHVSTCWLFQFSCGCEQFQ